MKFLKIILVSFYFSSTSAQIFASVDKQQQLGNNEYYMAGEMDWLAGELEKLIEGLRHGSERLMKEAREMLNGGLDYISNPLNGIVTIKKLSYDVDEIIESSRKIIDNFEQRISGFRLPREDFEGAVEGLLRLQLTYDLKTEDLAQGIIKDKKYRDDLTADELYAISETLFKKAQFTSSLGYLNFAYKRNKKTREIPEIPILESLLAIYKKKKNDSKQIEIIDKILNIDPSRQDVVELKVKLLEEKIEIYSVQKEERVVMKICNDEITRNELELPELYCKFHSTNAFSKLAPFKMEVFNIKPFIAVIHDFISEVETETVIETSREKLQRTQVLNPDSTNRYDNVRISMNCWHTDSSHEVYERLSLRVGDMSGLDMSKVESWQPQNYGIGGHYAAHFDFVTEDWSPFEDGNRVATVLVYMSDVEKGGSTIFPYLKIHVKPAKGIAIFWHNLSPSGHLEYLTKHVGCPVLVGSKWVANKWLHEHGQERARPCGLKPELTDPNIYQELFRQI